MGKGHRAEGRGGVTQETLPKKKVGNFIRSTHVFTLKNRNLKMNTGAAQYQRMGQEGERET